MTAKMTRQQPLLTKESPPATMRCAEVAGGTAASCAAICCCCPCGLLNLIILAVVKLPAALCRKVTKKRKRKRKEPQQTQQQSTPTRDEPELKEHHVSGFFTGTWPEKSPSAEVSDMDEQMWAKFHGAGFWRTPSAREEER